VLLTYLGNWVPGCWGGRVGVTKGGREWSVGPAGKVGHRWVMGGSLLGKVVKEGL